uniref:Putative heat shock protein 23 n=1 Tax=Haematobia irritans TaxID=7368 RepID=A0A1L8EFM6_HAEIR
MSSLPYLISLLGELDHETPYYGHDFGLGLSPYLIQKPTCVLPLNVLRRLSDHQSVLRAEKDHGVVSPVGKDGFQVCLDVTQFKPNELTVKVVDNCVIVEGKHEEREDQHGYIQRHFVRRYVLPKDYDAEKVASTLSSDGVLTVSVPKPQIKDKSNERVIQIQQTGPAHLHVKQNTEEKSPESNGTKADEKK